MTISSAAQGLRSWKFSSNRRVFEVMSASLPRPGPSAGLEPRMEFSRRHYIAWRIGDMQSRWPQGAKFKAKQFSSVSGSRVIQSVLVCILVESNAQKLPLLVRVPTTSSQPVQQIIIRIALCSQYPKFYECILFTCSMCCARIFIQRPLVLILPEESHDRNLLRTTRQSRSQNCIAESLLNGNDFGNDHSLLETHFAQYLTILCNLACDYPIASRSLKPHDFDHASIYSGSTVTLLPWHDVLKALCGFFALSAREETSGGRAGRPTVSLNPQPSSEAFLTMGPVIFTRQWPQSTLVPTPTPSMFTKGFSAATRRSLRPPSKEPFARATTRRSLYQKSMSKPLRYIKLGSVQRS